MAIRPQEAERFSPQRRATDQLGMQQRSQCLPFPVVIASALLISALLLLGPAAARSKADQCGGADRPAYSLSGKAAAKATLCLLNKERSSRGMKALRFDRDQQKAASKHNRVMLQQDCFSHLCPGEKDLVGRIVSTGYLPCTCTWGVAENLAWGEGPTSTPAAVVNAWMNSPDHRVNILNPRYDEIGIAVDDGSPEGGGPAATYTTDFGFKD